jgi:hypothetical protein
MYVGTVRKYLIFYYIFYQPQPPPPLHGVKIGWKIITLFHRFRLIRSTSEPEFLNFQRAPKNRFQGINSASLCSLTGRYDNPIPTRCLAPIDYLKIFQHSFQDMYKLYLCIGSNNALISRYKCPRQFNHGSNPAMGARNQV